MNGQRFNDVKKNNKSLTFINRKRSMVYKNVKKLDNLIIYSMNLKKLKYRELKFTSLFYL